ncbi:hypothetical protein [Maribacter flavus]|uniref:Uncharacterized protein n=1 Tax=Maribacter flavus TaxID=1658664 RepID=A0A5B2TVK2_9FLAO|nr:hypothetical protein [Maribacter flavus]KAA2218279.1 hypothetical protein F0361_01265 [Maribacter flavus]
MRLGVSKVSLATATPSLYIGFPRTHPTRTRVYSQRSSLFRVVERAGFEPAWTILIITGQELLTILQSVVFVPIGLLQSVWSSPGLASTISATAPFPVFPGVILFPGACAERSRGRG